MTVRDLMQCAWLLASWAFPKRDIPVPKWLYPKGCFQREMLEALPSIAPDAYMALRNGEEIMIGVRLKQ